ncbi:MAG: hypothetical protein PHW93_00775 [Candidatus Methanomethylophilaceae archaeon]|nr:hypothetical protein [Candidatus Methanomethylophilaceae archaeon]
MEFNPLEELGLIENKQFIGTCRGLVTNNDNAYQLCESFVPDGDRLFSIVSRYDDIQSYVFNRENYKAGDTLKLVLPFLCAYGATDSSILKFSRDRLDLVQGAAKTMRYLNSLMPSFIITNAYEHHMMAVCDEIDFPFSNVYCTQMQMDSVEVDDLEKKEIRDLAEEISAMPVPEIPAAAVGLSDFSSRDQATITRLDEIFWDYMLTMDVHELVGSVNPIGGNEKAYSVLDVRRKTMIDLDETMYVGGGITDFQAMDLVRDSGGLSVSFNGNAYAVRESNVAVMAPHAVVVSVLAAAFYNGGLEAVYDLVDAWDRESLEKTDFPDRYLLKEMLHVFPEELPPVIRVDRHNVDDVAFRSELYRMKLYGRGGDLT